MSQHHKVNRPIEPPVWLTVSKVSERTMTSPDHVRRAIAAGQLAAVGEGKLLRVHIDEVDRWAAQGLLAHPRSRCFTDGEAAS